MKKHNNIGDITFTTLVLLAAIAAMVVYILVYVIIEHEDATEARTKTSQNNTVLLEKIDNQQQTIAKLTADMKHTVRSLGRLERLIPKEKGTVGDDEKKEDTTSTMEESKSTD